LRVKSQFTDDKNITLINNRYNSVMPAQAGTQGKLINSGFQPAWE